MRLERFVIVFALVIVFFVAGSAVFEEKSRIFAQEPLPQDLIRQVGFDQRLDAQVPLEATFMNSEGQFVRLGDLLGDKPVLLSLGYYECPMLCTLIRSGLLSSLQELDAFTVGEEFEVIFISVDPDESVEIAAETKDITVAEYMRSPGGQGWHFLVGSENQTQHLAEAIGFRYVYDPRSDEYVHPSGVVVLTPEGRVAKYFFGIDFPARDLRLGLIEAAENRIGSIVDQLLLTCYHYDPISGQYTLSIMNIIRIAGVFTVLTILSFVFLMLYRERRNPSFVPKSA